MPRITSLTTKINDSISVMSHLRIQGLKKNLARLLRFCERAVVYITVNVPDDYLKWQM